MNVCRVVLSNLLLCIQLGRHTAVFRVAVPRSIVSLCFPCDRLVRLSVALLGPALVPFFNPRPLLSMSILLPRCGPFGVGCSPRLGIVGKGSVGP